MKKAECVLALSKGEFCILPFPFRGTAAADMPRPLRKIKKYEICGMMVFAARIYNRIASFALYPLSRSLFLEI